MDSDVCSHVKVVVRVRPASECEKLENLRNIIQVVDKHMLIFDPKDQEESHFGLPRARHRNINKRSNKDLKYFFDHVFDENSTQADIFENTTKGVLDGVMNGFNCTVFAYGATGAGKTHTMLGSQDEPGVMYCTMKELFRRMDDAKDEKEFGVAFSYLEVYNEKIRDLLANSGPLAVREDSSKGVVVQGLTLHQPKSAEHILNALDSGNRHRTQHPTDVNATSSRSHAVFQIYLRQQDKTASLNPNVCVAKMSLIDLAGSERASATNAKGARLREGANINRSLLALGNVINALADPKSKKAHIPYRDSKLTRLLKDSLGGNCRTVMIANVSPSSKSYEDTHNTLKYANRAKEIKSSLKSNVVSLDSHIGQYAVICEKQRQEIVQLKQKLQKYEKKPVMPGASNAAPSQKQAECTRVSDALRQIFSQRTDIRREQLDLERQLKVNELRQRYSEEDNLQIRCLCAKERLEKATCKHERKLASLRTQQQHISKRLKEAGERFLDNDGWLHRVENEMKMLKADDHLSEVLEKDLRCHRLELQVKDLRQQIEQMVELTALQDQENKRVRKMLSVLLPAYSRQYGSMLGAGLLGAADQLENHELESIVLRERGVAWADQEESGAERTSQKPSSCSAAPPSKGKGSPMVVSEKVFPAASSRRSLAVLLQEEGVFPLQFTPEAVPPPSLDPNVTFDLENEEETFILSGVGPCGASRSASVPGRPLRPAGTGAESKAPPRCPQAPSFRANASYMDMTAAAQKKRKINHLREEADQGLSAPKRIKKDPAVSRRPMRVQQVPGSEENQPRRVVRSISEGNLFQPQRSRSLFSKASQHLRRVAKRT